MKTTFFILSCLCLAFTTNLASAATNAVIDVDGQELRAGTHYYILPVVRGNGGGLKLYSGRTSQCPQDVVQEPNEVNRGYPVKFLPANQRDKTIRVSSDLNIQFSASSICTQSTVWRLDGGGSSSGQLYVSTGGVVGNPSQGTINNWFRIEKVQSGRNWYKLVYCPGVCNTCRPRCGDLGIIIEKSGTRLWLSILEKLSRFSLRKPKVLVKQNYFSLLAFVLNKQ